LTRGARVPRRLPLLEFTNRGDHAWEVVDPGTASLYINCGANFVIGLVLNPEVARACNRRKVRYSPDCGTASEVSQAEERGCESLRLWFDAGVACVGLGSTLITKDLLQAKDYEGLANEVRSTRDIIRKMRN